MGYLIKTELKELANRLNAFINLEIYIAKRNIEILTIPENFK